MLGPLSGVMSAWPLVGRHPSASSLKRLPQALSPDGKAIGHAGVTLQAWQRAAQRHTLPRFDAVLSGLAGWAEHAIERVASELPEHFPASVSGPVFEGVRRSARLLLAG